MPSASGYLPDNSRINTQHKYKVRARKFAREYVAQNGNGKQAILNVDPNVTPNSASQIASRYLKNDDVKKQIEKILNDRKIDAGWVLDKRLQFIQAGADQLEGAKRPKGATAVSSNDVSQHLTAIERLIEKTWEDKSNNTKFIIHAGSIKEAVAKRHQLNSWFNEIIEGEVIEEAQNEPSEQAELKKHTENNEQEDELSV